MSQSVAGLVAQEPYSVHPCGACCARLDKAQWHFQHGPIDLLIGVDGPAAAVESALSGAWNRFVQILPELVAELAVLRCQARTGLKLNGPIAARMLEACLPYAPDHFLTPMAAVAGAVADDLMACFNTHAEIERVYINNGGDIALHIGPGGVYHVGLFSDLARYRGDEVQPDGRFLITPDLPVRGIATSGWRGRSFSLGIADSVTVLAADAVRADVAATMVANQVWAQHEAVQRAPANTLKDDTDLGARLVTVDVGPLPGQVIDAALERGAQFAGRLCREGTIYAAVLMLQGALRVVGLDDAVELGYMAQQGQPSRFQLS